MSHNLIDLVPRASLHYLQIELVTPKGGPMKSRPPEEKGLRVLVYGEGNDGYLNV